MACEACLAHETLPEGKPVHQAVVNHHSDCLASILEEHPDDINAVVKGPVSWTPLHVIVTCEISAGQEDPERPLKILRQLLAHPNIDVNARDSDGKTALHIVANEGSFKALQALVESGKTDLKATSNNGMSVLHWVAGASEFDDPMAEMVTYLVGKGCDANARDNFGRTPLHIVADGPINRDEPEMHLFVSTASALINGGAEIDAKDNGGKTALNIAACESMPQLVGYLLSRGANPKNPDQCVLGDTFENLERFTSEEDVDSFEACVSIVKDLGDWGGLEIPTDEKICAEEYSEQKGKYKYYGSPVPVGTKYPGIIHHVMAVAEHKDYSEEHLGSVLQKLVSALVEIGADTSVVHEGLTPLHVACLRGWSDCVSALVWDSCDEATGIVNARGLRGQTALHIAARKNHSGIVSELLWAEADHMAKDDLGDTPLDKANRWECKQAATVLMRDARNYCSRDCCSKRPRTSK